MPLPPLAAPVPADLHDMDDLLQRWGAWAGGRATGTPGGPDVRAVHAATQRLPARWRAALVLLYVPDRQSVAARMRRLGLTPGPLRDAHLAGLYALRNLLRRGAGVAQSASILTTVVSA